MEINVIPWDVKITKIHGPIKGYNPCMDDAKSEKWFN
jgi:hypothetical protein